MALDRSKLVRAIASAWRLQPALSYQQLAAVVGVGRSTLYRLAPTREGLLDLLRSEALAASRVSLERARLDVDPPVEALTNLTRDYLSDFDLYAFWLTAAWNKDVASQAGAPNVDLYEYRATMVQFFERGQREGAFRPDVPAIWLVQLYDALFMTASLSFQEGWLARNDMLHLFLQSFLRGAAGPKAG